MATHESDLVATVFPALLITLTVEPLGSAVPLLDELFWNPISSLVQYVVSDGSEDQINATLPASAHLRHYLNWAQHHGLVSLLLVIHLKVCHFFYSSESLTSPRLQCVCVCV